MNIELSFHGAAGTVTGSRHLVTTDSTRVLVDAGMFQGLKKLRERNWRRPAFDPDAVDHLLLTHAHIDHSGYLPRLVRDGLKAPVHCTEATANLAALMLPDAAKIQEEDARYANRKGYSKHSPALPLYTAEDADAALELLAPTSYDTWVELNAGMRARFHNAGHILGASHVELRIDAGGRERRIVFSGDLGRYDVPLHPDPSVLPACDALIIESTYGDRSHTAKSLEEQVGEPIRRTLGHGGVVLIPAFAVGRSQLVTLTLRELMKAGELPEVPIHIDSPMAINATRIYSRHLDARHLDEELLADGRSRLFPHNVQFHRSVEESKRLNEMEGPRIILSASGMLSGGRILHHLRRRLPDRKNLLLLVGYQAAGTRGRALLGGARTLRMHGMDVPVEAEFISISGLSAHADREELLRWVREAESPPRLVFVVHGEPDSSAALAETLRGELAAQVFVPELEEAFDLARLMA